MSDQLNSCPLVTVSVTNEEMVSSKENLKIDQDDLDATNTLDIDPASYEGNTLFNFDKKLVKH